jgi:hypothetical protein
MQPSYSAFRKGKAVNAAAIVHQANRLEAPEVS